ncbi:MAG: DUF1302 family protein [Candidatus Desulfofervidaceae bacterium]|nr:DUF1302 family protein [Candidatus Desulfofervidaceae bacterium]MDL1969814.1 DUF1302 domain-containing protein [Candidatus Desulfofervidaceae bacterium]
MKRWSLIILTFFLFTNGAGATLYHGHGVTLEGALKNETGVYLDDPGKFIKIMDVIDLKGQYRPTDYLSFFAHIYKFWDHVYNVEDDYQSARYWMYTNRKAWTGISWVRELYLDFFSDYLDVRLGKQIVTWGTADGIRILDQVNPLDYREFTLKDWNEIKIPLWMTKIEVVPTVNGSLQFLFIPDFEPNFSPPAGAPFAFKTTILAAKKYAQLGATVTENRPAETFSNAKFGVRWRDIINGWEYTLNYLYGWNMNPETYAVSRTRFVKQYSRINLWGGSFSKTIVNGPFQGLTVRGEFAYFKNVPAAYRNAQGQTAYHKIDKYQYVLGLDKYLISNWLFSFQFIQLINSQKDYQGYKFLLSSGGPADKVSTYLTLKIATDFFHERLKPEILFIYGDDNEWRISPKLYFEINDHLTTTAGMHIFVGKETELYGQFNDKNELFLEVRYSF